jgi:hypothetical protein
MEYGRKKITVRKGKKVRVRYRVKEKEEKRDREWRWMGKRYESHNSERREGGRYEKGIKQRQK